MYHYLDQFFLVLPVVVMYGFPMLGAYKIIVGLFNLKDTPVKNRNSILWGIFFAMVPIIIIYIIANYFPIF